MALPLIIPDDENGKFRAVDSEGKKSDAFGNVKEGKRAIDKMPGLAQFEKILLKKALPGVFLTLKEPPPLSCADLRALYNH